MPDPGMAVPPELAPGQREYNTMLANTDQATADAWKRDEAMKLLKSGKFSPNDVNAYFGEHPATPSPAAHDAAVAHTDRAVQSNGGDNSFLADPARAMLTGVGLDKTGVDWYLSSVRAEQQRDDQGYKAAQGSFSAAFSGKEDIVGGAKDVAQGVMDFTGAGFQNAVSAVTGPLYEGVAKPLYKNAPVVGEAISAVSKVNQAAADSLYGNLGKYVAPVADPKDPHALSDAVGAVMLMAGGGEHFGETAKVPEAGRALAVDGMRDGTLRDPTDLLKTSGHDDTAVATALPKIMPSTADFTAGVEQLAGAKVWADPIAKTGLTPTGQRVLYNLQQIYADTGRGPQDVVAQAAKDPAFADELVQQDMYGQAVTPKFNASAPKPPPQATPTAREPTAVAQGPLAHAASEGVATSPHGTFVNTPDRAAQIMTELEGSPDRNGKPQISKTGAVGQYQIEPGTARQYGFDPAKLSDPAYNQMAGHAIINKLYEKFHGNMEAMAIAYNDGPGRAQQWLNRGAGTRLEAVRDNTVRGGWRYEKVAAPRDESFMPLETQQYVARARFKMNGKEPTPEPGAPEQQGNIQPEADVAGERDAAEREQMARIADETQAAAEAEGNVEADEVSLNKSLSAASPYEGMSTEERVAESMRSIGEQAVDQEGLLDSVKTAEGRAKIGEGVSNWVAKRMRRWVSQLDPANRVDIRLQKAGKLRPKEELTMADAFRNTASSDDRTAWSLTRGKVTGNMTEGHVLHTEEGGTLPRVLQAIQDAGSDTDKFHTRLLSERTLNRITASGKKAKAAGKPFSKGIEDAPATPISPMLAHANMMDPELAKLDEAVAHWNDMRDGKLAYMRDNGMLSDTQMENLKASDPTWMSWQKMAGEPLAPGNRSGGFGLKNPIMGLKGHSDAVINAFDGLWNDTRLAFKMSDRNAARQFARSLMERDPETALHYGFREVTKVDVNEDFVDKALRESGVDPKEITDELRDAAAPIIAARMEKALPENHFYIWDEGKPTEYAVNSPELASMFKGAASREETSTIFKSMAAVGKFERALQIANPEFAGRVLGVMHPFQTFLFDKSVPHHFPLEELFKGWGDVMGHTDLYEQAKVHGAFADWADQVDKRWVDAQTLSASNVQAGERMNQPNLEDGDIVNYKTPDGQYVTIKRTGPDQYAHQVNDTYSLKDPTSGSHGYVTRAGLDRMIAERGLTDANKTVFSASNIEAGKRMSEPGTAEYKYQAEGGAFDGKRNIAKDPIQFAQMVKDSYLNPMKWPQAGRDLMSKMSEINRMGGYKMSLEAGMAPAKAAANARKMFLDFQEHGASNLSQQYSSIVNYQHAHILGTKQVFEAFTNGADARDTLVKTFASIMVPSAGMQALCMAQDQMLPENERYTNIDQWKKDSMLISPQMPWGGRIMVPYPWGVTPVIMMQQRILEGAYGGVFGDTASKAKWGDTTFWLDLAKTFVPPLIPSAVEPAADVITNRRWSSGAPLNSDAVLSRLPADRYTFSTSQTGRALGKFLAPITAGFFSPANIDHLIGGYLGTPGMGALKAVDGVYHAGTATGRPLDMGDIPVVNWMVHTAPGFSGQHIDDFYSQYQDFQEQKGSFQFFKKQAKAGVAGAMEGTDVDADQVQATHALSRVAGMLNMDRSIAYAVESTPRMPDSEKSGYLKALYAHAVVASLYGTAYMDIMKDRTTTDEQKESLSNALQAKLMPRLQELEAQFPHAG